MLKLNYTKEELKEVTDKIYLSDMQKRIMLCRMRDLSIVQIAELEHCSVSKINNEIKKIKNKLEKIK